MHGCGYSVSSWASNLIKCNSHGPCLWSIFYLSFFPSLTNTLPPGSIETVKAQLIRSSISLLTTTESALTTFFIAEKWFANVFKRPKQVKHTRTKKKFVFRSYKIRNKNWGSPLFFLNQLELQLLDEMLEPVSFFIFIFFNFRY